MLRGLLRVEHAAGVIDVRAGQAIVTSPASGSATAPRNQMAQSMSPSASRRSRQPPYTATGTLKVECPRGHPRVTVPDRVLLRPYGLMTLLPKLSRNVAIHTAIASQR